MTVCLVGPLQAGDAAIAADYRRFFQRPEVQMLPVTAAVWERAAEIRATSRLPALDSIHLAAATEHGCGRFLTNDGQLSRCTSVRVDVLV
jgi:predicted nucleic acid-binding protein